MGTENLSIRSAHDGDKATLERLIADCYGTVYPGWYNEEVLGDAMPALLRIDTALLASGRYFVAMLGDAVAGCGGWSTNSPGSSEAIDKTGHIRHFATRPDLMGKGVGGAIIERCIAEADQAEMKHLRCFSSLPAEGFYARHGFVKLDNVNVMLRDGAYFPAVLMAKNLNS